MHFLHRTVSNDLADWVKWTDGAASGDIDIDNDGVMPSTRFLVDISHALSQRLGRQMSQFMVYKVDYVRIDMVNVDDVVDNTSGAQFSGRCDFWSPTKHRIDAMKLARVAEKASEDTQTDGDAWFFSNQHDYRGLRFNYDADGQVRYATGESLTGTLLPDAEWNLQTLFGAMDNNLEQVTKANSLWNNRTGFQDQFGWSTAYINYENSGTYAPRDLPFTLERAGLEVLGGLMMFSVTHSSTDAPGSVDDDYNLRITIGVSGWSEI